MVKDFDTVYPHAGSILENWNDFFSSIFELFEKNLTDQDRLLSQLLDSDTLSPGKKS